MTSKKEKKTRKTRKTKTMRGRGLFSKLKKWNAGCPIGEVRKWGSACGFIRGPLGCCRKQLKFSDLKLGGRKTRKI